MEQPEFNAELHLKYWQRCLKSLLPTQYTSTDSARMMLGFLILAALDLLGAGGDKLPPNEVKNLKAWILNCQHPNGGFCGSPNHKYPDEFYADSGRRDIEPANLAATFFALINLNFLGGIREVQRTKCLAWLAQLQRSDGSFGEWISEDGVIEGGRDMRYCHFAAGIRWMLRGDLQAPNGQVFKDIDVDKLVAHIRAGETYDGGIGETSEHEAHAGYTYCGIAALAFLNRTLPADSVHEGLPDPGAAFRWLLSRQISYEDQERDDDEDDDTGPPIVLQGLGHYNIPSLASLSLKETQFVGCNGRLNKSADTCYCYWVSGALDILGNRNLINSESLRRFLIEQTQHRIGGFGKEPHFVPDLYHSYLGLACLSLMGEPGLKSLDSVLCTSMDARNRLENDIREALEPVKVNLKFENILIPKNKANIDENVNKRPIITDL